MRVVWRLCNFTFSYHVSLLISHHQNISSQQTQDVFSFWCASTFISDFAHQNENELYSPVLWWANALYAYEKLGQLHISSGKKLLNNLLMLSYANYTVEEQGKRFQAKFCEIREMSVYSKLFQCSKMHNRIWQYYGIEHPYHIPSPGWSELCPPCWD